MKAFFLFAAIAAITGPTKIAAAPLEIKVAPQGYVYVHDANPRRGQFDLMVQSVVVKATAPANLTALRIDYEKKGEVRASRLVSLDAALGATSEFAGMMQGGFDTFLRAQLLSKDGLEAFAGDGTVLASDLQMSAGEALISTGHFQTLDFEPDRLVIIAIYETDGGTAQTRLPVAVVRAESSIEYRFPLEGTWIMRGLPSARGHHRWIPGNEFAVDLFRVGANGADADGDPLIAENNYGYGAPVHAAADGEVVFVNANETQDRRAQWVLPGETMDEARERVGNMNMQRVKEDYVGALAGNLITIRHVGANGAVEYSNYAHLKAGSVRVKPGQLVASGEIIGEVGDTGDSSAVHLHFQVNEGPNAFFSRSIPFDFSDMEETYEGQDPGLFVRAKR